MIEGVTERKRRLVCPVRVAQSLASDGDEVGLPFGKNLFCLPWIDDETDGLRRHPGIAALFDAGQTDDGVFFATEFIEGVSLADHLDAGVPLSLAERVSIAVQLADALEYAGEQGVPPAA